jgi:hypothetical protein
MAFVGCLGEREVGVTQFEEKGSWHESAREVGRRARRKREAKRLWAGQEALGIFSGRRALVERTRASGMGMAQARLGVGARRVGRRQVPVR